MNCVIKVEMQKPSDEGNKPEGSNKPEDSSKPQESSNSKKSNNYKKSNFLREIPEPQERENPYDVLYGSNKLFANNSSYGSHNFRGIDQANKNQVGVFCLDQPKYNKRFAGGAGHGRPVKVMTFKGRYLGDPYA